MILDAELRLNLPDHFLQSALPNIGGCCTPNFIALPTLDNSQKAIAIRPRNPDPESCPDPTNELIQKLFPWAAYLINADPRHYVTSSLEEDILSEDSTVQISHPNLNEAVEAEHLQASVWNTKDTYPFDLYLPDSPTATKLVAVSDRRVVGLLLGFWGQETGNFWVESQILTTSPESRSTGIGRKLKLEQQKEAANAGIDVIKWTVDPLQKPNAYLNFNSLGALATSFHPKYYEFNNDLNTTPASRFHLEWASNSSRSEEIRRLFSHPDPNQTIIGSPLWEIPTKLNERDLLIEIPTNWTILQKDRHEEAVRIRKLTDNVFSKLIGRRDDGYLIGHIVEHNAIPYLVAKPYMHLISQLGKT